MAARNQVVRDARKPTFHRMLTNKGLQADLEAVVGRAKVPSSELIRRAARLGIFASIKDGVGRGIHEDAAAERWLAVRNATGFWTRTAR